MKKLLMALIILIAFSLSANAQVSQPFTLYAGGAMSWPMSDNFKAAYKPGYHGMLGIGYKMGPSFELVGKVEYHTFKFDFGDASGISGGTNKMWMYGVDGRYGLNLPASPISPFILGGAGFANIKASEFEGTSSLVTSLNSYNPESATKFYWNVGGGVQLMSGPKFSLFAQARYVSIATEGETSTFVPVTVGLKFF